MGEVVRSAKIEIYRKSTTPGETELVVADNAGPALRWLVVEPIADVVARLERDRLER